MILVKFETTCIAVLIILTIGSQLIICVEYLTVSEDTNFIPCSVRNYTLLCDALQMDPQYRNKTIKFSLQNPQKIMKIEILNFFIDEIPEYIFGPFASVIVSAKIVSKSIITVINPLAFLYCKNITFLEINGLLPMDNISINFDNVLTPLLSLQELRLININIPNLLESSLTYLTNLKSLTINSPFFSSISTDVFRNNKNLESLTFIGLKNPTYLIETLENWPSTSQMNLKSLRIDKCNLKHFPKFSANFVRNLTELSLAKNPIEQIDLNITISLEKLEVLSLVSTKLNWNSVSGLRLLKNLKDLILNDVITLKDLPKEIEGMEFLESIYLDMSKFEKISVALPSSIKKVSASNLQKPLEITSNFLSRSKNLSILYMIALPMDNIQFLLDNIKVINNSLQVLSLDDTSLIKNRLLEFLSSLRNLEVLHLNKANIDFITDNVLFNLGNLKQLLLSGNQLRYESINTNGFQSILGHIVDLDLSKNPMTYLPPCMFYTFSNFDRLNLQGNNFVCDCNMMWFYEIIKSQNITNKLLNFTCTTGPNDGKSFYNLLEKDLKNCTSKQIDNCSPLKTGLYRVPFLVKYKRDSAMLSIFEIRARYLRFVFDYFTITVRQFNTSLHTDFDKYDITRTALEMSLETKLADLEVCIVLNRNKVDYIYKYNCQTVAISTIILESNMTHVIGAVIGIFVFVVIVVLVTFFLCRKLRRGKKMQSEYYEASSTEYSEPDDTYKSPDQYTEISGKEYSIDQGDIIDLPNDVDVAILAGISSFNRTSTLQNVPSISLDNIMNPNKIPLNQPKSRFRKRPYISKLISKARSSTALVDNTRNSFPTTDNSISMRDLQRGSTSTLPRQYINRELPLTPPTKDFDAHVVDFGPPKPRLTNYNIQHLLNNTDEHLRKFSQYVSNSSLNNDRSLNRSHSAEIGTTDHSINRNVSDDTSMFL